MIEIATPFIPQHRHTSDIIHRNPISGLEEEVILAFAEVLGDGQDSLRLCWVTGFGLGL